MKEIDIPENISNDIFLMNIPVSRIKNIVLFSSPFILLFYFTYNITFLLISIVIIIIPFIKIKNDYLDSIIFKNIYFIFSGKRFYHHEIEKYASLRKYEDPYFFWNSRLCLAYEVNYMGNDLLDEVKKEEIYNKFIELLNMANIDITIFSVYDEFPTIEYGWNEKYSDEIKNLILKINEKKKLLKSLIVFSTKRENRSELNSIENLVSGISTFEFSMKKINADEFSRIIWRLWSGW